MNRLYRYTAALLAVLAAAFALTACSPSGSSDNTVTLTVYDQSSAFSGGMTGWFADVIRNKFNLRLNFRSAYDEGFNAYVEQGVLADIIVFNNESSYRTARDAGILLDLEADGLLDGHGGYILDHYGDALGKNRKLNADGRLYGVYGNVCSGASGHEDFYDCFYIRWDLYAALGYPGLDTLEDFEPVLADMVKLASADSDSAIYGISAFNTWDDTMLDLVRATAGLYGYTDFGFGLYNPSSDSYEPCIDSDGIYVRCLRFYNSLYRAGLLDPSSESQSYTMTQKDYKSGRAVLGMYKYITDPYNTATRLSNGKYMIPIAAKDFSNIADEYSSYGHDTIWSISSKCTEPELAMQLLDWLYTPEGVLTNLYGPEDVTWSFDDSGSPYITEFGYTCLTDGDTEMPEGYNGTYNTGYSIFGTMNVTPDSLIEGANGASYSLLTWDSVTDSGWYEDNYGRYADAISDWREHTGADDLDGYIEGNGCTIIPATDFVCDELPSDLFLTKSEISGDICTNSWLAIYAESEEAFDKAVQTMQEACTSRSTYADIMDFYGDMLEKYKQSLK